ncbi:transcriptional regulator [Streptococcus mutans]|nr:transcriptional regulator [Streptococcus mutans]
MEVFHISKRTALRDIQELEKMGLALYTENGRGGGYRILPQSLLVPIHISHKELSAIFYALKALEKVITTPFDYHYPTIIKKLQCNLTPEQSQTVEQTLSVIDYYNVSAINPPSFLPDILTAILDETVLSIHYTQNQDKWLTVQFYDLFYREGVWFSHGYQLTTDTWAIFRCDYIQSLSINEDRKGISRDSLKLSLEEHERHFRSVPFRCRLTPFGKELFHKNHYEGMSLTEENQQTFLNGYYNPNELHYLTHYLIEFGKHIYVESPKELQEAYLAELDSIKNLYPASPLDKIPDGAG